MGFKERYVKSNGKLNWVKIITNIVAIIVILYGLSCIFGVK